MYRSGCPVSPGGRYAFFQAIDKSERQPEDKTREQLGTLADETLSILAHGAESPRLNEILSGLRARGLGDYVRVDLRLSLIHI